MVSILISAGALGISFITAMLVAYLVRRPPSESTELVEMKTRLVALDQEVVDVADRLAQWMRRESVRKMREGKEDSLARPSLTNDPRERKVEIRRRAMANRSLSE